MRNKLILVMVFALVFAFSCAAYAEVQNVKVGGDITAVGLSRESLDFHKGNNTETSANNEFASIARIRIDADLTDSVGVTFRLLNERVWGGATGNTGANVSTTELDVDLAYVTLKEFMKPTINVPLNLIIGRQNIKIGSGLLVGAANTNQSNTNQLPAGAGDLSANSAFDAIVGVWDFAGLTMITGYVKASDVTITQGDDTDVYVADATYKLGEDAMNAMLEGTYVLSRTVRANVNNYGARATFTPIENTNIEGEYVYQTANSRRKAASDAIRLNGTLGLPDVVWKPTVGLDYMRLSNHWAPCHESLSPASLANLIFANTNLAIYGASVSVTPMDDLSLNVRYANLNLTKKLADNAVTYTSAGTGVTYATVANRKPLGYEVDLGLAYDYTSDVQFGLNYGLLKPGKAFAESNRKAASQVLGSMKVSF